MGKYFNAKNLKLATYLATFLVAIFMFNSANAPRAYAAETASISSTASGGIVELSQLAPSSTTGAYTSGKDTVNVSTSCSSGYKVYVSGTSDSKYGTNLVNVDDNTATIPTVNATIGSEVSIASNSTASWGVRLGSGNTFAGLPTYASVTNNTAKEIYAGSDLSKSLDIYYGVNVTSSTVPGTYEGKVLYTVLVNNACATYTIKYDANNGTGSMDDQIITVGSNPKLSKNTFSRTGYTFLGWDTNSSATTATYADEYTLTSDLAKADGEVTLHAIWRANTVTVSFSANGGSGTTMASQVFTYNTAQALSANTYTRTNYVFKGWATSASGSKVYGNKQSVTASTLNSSVSSGNQTRTLYAVWGPAVTFANAGLTSGSSYMQDMTTAKCSQVSAGQTTTLVDKRDNNTYTILKLDNSDTATAISGKCIMTENLKFGYSSLSKKSTGQTVSVNSTTSHYETATSTGDSSVSNSGSITIKYIAATGLSSWYSNTSSTYTNRQFTYDDTGTTYGYSAYGYYSWGAALVVCPAGWRLPTNAEWGASTGLLALIGTDGATRSTALRSSTYKFPAYTGLVFETSFRFRGEQSRYWSATSTGENAYDMYFGSSSGSTYPDLKRFGMNVRCISI